MFVVAGLLALSFVPRDLLEDAPPELQETADSAADIRRSFTEWSSDLLSGLSPEVQRLLEEHDLWPFEPQHYDPVPAGELPRTPSSWNVARRVLYEEVHHDSPRTLYCRCAFNSSNEIDLRSCGMNHLIGNSRAERVEAEHVFPASQFGNFRECWREPENFEECYTRTGNVISGRNCCQRVDQLFMTAYTDLHNLYPSVGYINGRRSNFNWGMISSGETFGDCEIRIDASIRRAQPPQHAKGFIARTMLYMRDTYGFRLSRQDEQLYAAWNNQFPPDEWEIERNRRIRAIQGMGNPYIEEYRRL
ncbi:hypothetical protein CKO15_09775 [Halorhodospira abdelmalekii]|nr:endonuclease [Halorhodospira abdelmalekii]MBK1735566.1 hypothetical protein [Halorhodospira abdelmalekii]